MRSLKRADIGPAAWQWQVCPREIKIFVDGIDAIANTAPTMTSRRFVGLLQPCCTRDEGGPLGPGLQDQGSNHRKIPSGLPLATPTSFVLDLTERKRAEEALSQAQRLSRTGNWIHNATTMRYLHWSDESYRISGFDPL
jgi:hypothetical protein